MSSANSFSTLALSDDHGAETNGRGLTNEKSGTLKKALYNAGLEIDSDRNVRWRHNNPEHPRNWPITRKLYDLSIVILLEFFTTAISSAGTAASEQAREELKIGKILSLFSFTSTYMLGQGIGGIVFPPYSESFGRKKLYISSSIVYCVFCLIPGLVPHLPAIVICRFVSGIVSAIPTNVVAGSIEDLFDIGPRIWLIFFWLMMANLGLALGPIYGSYVTFAPGLGWRWTFYTAAIITGAISVGVLFIRESRPSQLLERQIAALRKQTGIEDLTHDNPDHTPDLRTFLLVTLVRPVRLFFTEPIVFVTSTLSGVAYGLIYLFTAAIPIVYASFGFSEKQASLTFLAICLGILCSLLTRFWDHIIFLRRQRAHQPLEPEDKLTGFALGSPILAIGLWWFAWTIPPKVLGIPWEVSAASLILVGYATTEWDTTLSGYVADSYTIYSASGIAAMAFLRALLCAIFPLFADSMFINLGSNVAITILAAASTLFCLAPVIILRYGRAIRERSPFAKYSLEISRAQAVDRYDSNEASDETAREVVEKMPPITEAHEAVVQVH